MQIVDSALTVIFKYDFLQRQTPDISCPSLV